MDLLTHALASYTLKRAAFPRLTPSVAIAMLVAGTVADIDSHGNGDGEIGRAHV